MTDSSRSNSSTCKQVPGAFIPVIDRNRCEGKGPCIEVCPKNVFVMGVLPKADRANLSIKGKMKGFAHGWKQAFLLNAAACEACGLCVPACPEKAITLARA